MSVISSKVNWPRLLGPFQNGFTTFFDVYVFGMSFCIIPAKTKSDIILLNCVLYQFNVVEST